MNSEYIFPIIQKRCHMMAHFSNYAYMDSERAQPFFEARGYPNHQFFDNKGSQAHVVWNDHEIVIAFRGTEPTESRDIKADLNVWPDHAEAGGWVHNGFQNALNKIWSGILLLLNDHQDKQILICGHSLGGAMATVAASRLKEKQPKLYTFGSPRVGNKDFVESFGNVVHYRFVNNNDLVTTIPMAFLGYRHHGSCMYINYHGEVRNFNTWQRLKDKLRGRWRALQKGQAFDGLYDHSCQYYCLYTSENRDGHH